jgi:hypothetical protein
MNRVEIICTALEAGNGDEEWEIIAKQLLKHFPEELERFAALVASAEREKCALRAEEFLTEPDPEWGGDFWNQAIERVADAIRARGNT